MSENSDYPRIQWLLHFFTSILTITVFVLFAPGGTVQADVGTDLDCTIHTSQPTGTQTSLQVGPMKFRTDADLTTTSQQAQAWKNLVDGFVVRYVGLCSAYNEGEITKDQFESHTEKLKGHYENTRQLEEKLSQQARDVNESASTTPISEGQDPEPTLLEAILEQYQNLEKLELPEGIPSGVVPRSPDFDLPPDPNKPPSTTGSIGVTPQQESEK